jgi:ribosomal protein S18 acetylase RimI-like enzyme
MQRIPCLWDSGPLAHYLVHWGRPGDRAFIAEADGCPVGAAWFRLFSAADKSYGYVADDIPELTLATLAGYRSMGIGTRLLQLLVTQAEQDGYSGISLSVGGSWTMLKRLG